MIQHHCQTPSTKMAKRSHETWAKAHNTTIKYIPTWHTMPGITKGLAMHAGECELTLTPRYQHGKYVPQIDPHWSITPDVAMNEWGRIGREVYMGLPYESWECLVPLDENCTAYHICIPWQAVQLPTSFGWPEWSSRVGVQRWAKV